MQTVNRIIIFKKQKNIPGAMGEIPTLRVFAIILINRDLYRLKRIEYREAKRLVKLRHRADREGLVCVIEYHAPQS